MTVPFCILGFFPFDRIITHQISFVNTFLSKNNNIFLFCINLLLNFGSFAQLYTVSDSKSLKKIVICDKIYYAEYRKDVFIDTEP